MQHWEKLYEDIKKLQQKIGGINLNLEEYLRAMLKLVLDNQEKKPSLDLFFKLMKMAFVSQPIALDKKWLDIDEPPIEQYDFELTDQEEGIELIKKEPSSRQEDLDFLTQVLKFQIAELHKMQKKQLQDQSKYFGVESETGNLWYNFDPFSNLEAGVRGYMDNIQSGTSPADSITWKTLGEIIELGRIYE